MRTPFLAILLLLAVSATAGRDFVAYGGHILSGVVGTGSLEIMITVHNKALERVMNEKLGANVLSLDDAP